MKADYPFRNSELPLTERVEDLIRRLTIEEKAGFISSRQAAIERLGISEWRVGCEIARGYVGRTPDEPSTVLPQPIGMAAMFDPDLMYQLGELAGNETRVYYQKEKQGKLILFGPTVDMERDPRWGRTEEAYGEDPYLTGQMSIAYTKGLKGEDPFYLRTVPGLKHFYANNNEKDRTSSSSNIEPRTKHEYYYKAFRPAIMEGGALSLMAAYNEVSGVPALLNPDLKTIVKDQWGLDFVVSDGGDFAGTVVDHEYVDNHAESIALAIKAGADIMLDSAEVVQWSVLEALKKGLLSEAELDESLRRSLAIRFRLGEFDPEEKNPYANLPEELVNCDKYKELNNKAAKEQVILLKNDGLLPLSKTKAKTVAVLGPLADKNYLDWYTGLSNYNVSILDGLKELLGDENITYDNCYDKVAIKSKANGKYLTVKEDETISAEADKVGISETFEYHDWDFGSQNLYSIKNKKFVREDKGMKAAGENTYGWFVKEWIKIKDISDVSDTYKNSLIMDTWCDTHIITDAEGKLITSNHPGLTKERQFQKEIVSEGISRAVAIAKQAEVAVVCVGNDPLQVARECYDRPDIVLPKHQSDLIKAVYEANPKTIVVMVSSYPYAVNWEKEHIPAMIYSSHAGPELGHAIADVLYGYYNPAGRTPMTWYQSVHELPDIMDYDIIQNDMTYLYYKGEPLYPFGYGLSYSTFEYRNMKLEKVVDNNSKQYNKPVIKLSVEIENTSKVDGEEVVQLYVKANNSRVKRPLRQLCGFQRIMLKSGEITEVTFTIKESELEFYDVTREKFCIETGDYSFMVGASSLDIRLEETIHIEGETIPPQTLRKWTPAINYDDKSGVAMKFNKERNAHYLRTDGMAAKYIKFGSVILDGVTAVEMNVATAIGKAAVSLHIDTPNSEPIGIVEIPVSGGPEQFIAVTGALKQVNGEHDLYLVFNQNMSILDLRLC
jgi:beta-glucosidase